MPQLTNTQLSNLRNQLLQEREDIEQRVNNTDHYGLADSLRDETGELSPIDNHPGDLGTELYERGKDIALLEQEQLHLSRVNAAIAAIDSGTYGHCLTCGVEIPLERLEALPDTLYCVQHSPRQNISYVRPIEEEVLYPPFGRTSLDESSVSNGFDGEDAWQIVEQWGTSNTPAMSENRNPINYDYVGIDAYENDGYVEPVESFLATDITGRHISVVRNDEYIQYMENDEGDRTLEDDEH